MKKMYLGKDFSSYYDVPKKFKSLFIYFSKLINFHLDSFLQKSCLGR